jgi:hypothetical protein
MKANQSLALFLIMFLSANTVFAKEVQDVNVVNVPTITVENMVTKVIGLSAEESTGVGDGAARDALCNATFPGSHWCSTQEYHDGGLAFRPDEPENAWIKPTVVSAVFDPEFNEMRFVDVTGLLLNSNSLNCNGWRSETASGTYLAIGDRHTGVGETSSVWTFHCSNSAPNVCCAPVVTK